MTKYITVWACHLCPYAHTTMDADQYNKFHLYCSRTNEVITKDYLTYDGAIPDWCPLSDLDEDFADWLDLTDKVDEYEYEQWSDNVKLQSFGVCCHPDHNDSDGAGTGSCDTINRKDIQKMSKYLIYFGWFVFGGLCMLLFLGCWAAFVIDKDDDDEIY